MISIIEIFRFYNNEWNAELNFYYVDLSNIDLAIDNRFKDVKNKRKDAKLLGVFTKEYITNNYKIKIL